MNKVLIVGINPQNTPWHKYIKKKLCTRARLHRWLDYLNLRFVGFSNCIPTPGPYNSKMIDYERLKKQTIGHTKIFALGNFPSKALSKLNIKHFKLPHPSPLNRLLNSKLYEKSILNRAKKYLKT